MSSYTILNPLRQTIIATHVELADTAQARRVGLLNHARLTSGQGLLIPGRNWLPFMAIHTIRMKFLLDVFFLDKNNRVLGLYTVPPNRIAWLRGARAVLETAEGTIALSQTQVGDEVEMRLRQNSKPVDDKKSEKSKTKYNVKPNLTE